jgi:hypothetical protein
MRGDVLSALLKIEQPEVPAPVQPGALAALEAAFWMLAAKSQAHLFQAPARAFDFSAFAPEARAFMDGPEQRLFDAMKAATQDLKLRPLSRSEVISRAKAHHAKGAQCGYPDCGGGCECCKP